MNEIEIKRRGEALVEELVAKGKFRQPKEGKVPKHAIKKGKSMDKKPISSKILSSDVAKKPQ